ncbi:MAG: peptidylprolyl isomerase [Verrucomicrobiota bacterium]
MISYRDMTFRLSKRPWALFCTVFGFAAFSIVIPTTPVLIQAEPTVLNSIKAVVNGEAITQTMLDAALQTQVQVWMVGNRGAVSPTEAEKQIRELESDALDDLIDRMLILSEFKRLGGDIKSQYIDESVARFVSDRFGGDRQKFVDELAKSGMTIAQFRDVQKDQIAIQALRSQHSGDTTIPPTPWEKRRKYNEIKDEFASEGRIKLRIMSIPRQTPTSSEAQQKAKLDRIMSSLRSGGSFAALAREHSADSFADKGGYIGVISRSGPLNKGLTGFAYSLPTGQASSPVEDGPFWRIIKSDGRVGQTVPDFDELEEEVVKRLTIEQRQKALETWLAKLRRDANVRIYD